MRDLLPRLSRAVAAAARLHRVASTSAVDKRIVRAGRYVTVVRESASDSGSGRHPHVQYTRTATAHQKRTGAHTQITVLARVIIFSNQF